MPAGGRPHPENQIERLVRELARADAIQYEAPGAAFGDGQRFRIVERLGEGAFGVVYLARDLATGAELALKTLPCVRAELLYRLKREFRLLADLRHPNLVAFYELFVERERVFFTMEYVRGTSFLAHVRRGARADAPRLRAALHGIARGLGALHEAGKLHRDVKPSNVLVTPEERVVLLDLGLGTDLSEAGRASLGEGVGTPRYIAPEVVAGGPATPASDWFGVGVMLHQALTGRYPASATAELPEDAPEDLSALCRRLLAPDPAARAGGAEVLVVAGCETTRAAGRGPSPARAGEAPFVGREAELRELRAALDRARAGAGVTALVEGPSGVGKTALVERFAAEAARRDRAVVLRGRCYERESVPYQGVDSLVDDLCGLLHRLPDAEAAALLPRDVGALLRLFPVLERVASVADRRAAGEAPGPDHQEVRRQAFGQLRELLARLGDREPLVLNVDDLQWADLDTAALLREVLRPPDAPAMLLVLTFRSEDGAHAPCVEALRRAPLGDAVRLRLGGLEAGAAEALLRELLDGAGQLDVARLAAEAAGNPFLLHELARGVAAEGAPASVDGAADIHAALRARIHRLPPTARALLEAVAVAGYPVPEAAARRAAGCDAPPWEAWHLLTAERLVRMSGPSDDRHVEAVHDRIREAVASGVAPERRVECHAGLASALDERAGIDAEVRAWHHESAGHPARARELALAAAAQAERTLAFERAARLFRWALRLDPQAADRGPLQASLAGALANAGRGVDAARAYLEAAEQAGPERRTALRRHAVEQLLLCGRIDEGRELATDTLRAVGLALPKTPRRALASLLLRRPLVRVRGLRFRDRAPGELDPRRLELLDHLWAICHGLALVDLVRGADLAARYLLQALAAGEPRHAARALLLEAGHSASLDPSSRRTRAVLGRLTRLDARLGDPGVHGQALLVEGMRAYFACAWRSVLSRCDEAERIFRERCAGVAWETWTARAFAGWALFQLGSWSEMGRRVDAQLREARELGNVFAETATVAPFGVIAWLARGEAEAARDHLAGAAGHRPVATFDVQQRWFLKAGCFLDLHAGDGRGAWDRLSSGWPRLAGSLMLRVPSLRYEMLYLRGALALAALPDAPGERRPALLAEATRAARLVGRVPTATARPFADALRAAAAARQGRTEEAADLVAAAAGAFDRLEMRAHAGAARRRLARLAGTPPPELLADEPVADPDAMARVLLPGFPEP